MKTLLSLANLKRVVLLAFFLITGAATSPTTAPATQPNGSTTVKIDNFRFDPEVVTVAVGATVTWINRDDVPHTVTASAKPRAFASEALDTDDQFSHTFARPGTYAYFCAVHPHMTGRVIVK